MKAMRLTASTLASSEVPEPRPNPGEVLIRVYAAGVTSTELLWYPTLHQKSGEERVGAIPGHEFSGVVAALGAETSGFTVGQEVFGMNDWFAEGAMAEYCAAPAADVILKPAGLSHIEAASVPIAALTAWQGLLDHARLRAGERVLVQGGAGGVGAFAVQIAKLRGAHVIATASARNLEFVASLGAGQVIDYRKTLFESESGPVDVVFDTVGGEVLQRSWSVLKPGGRMVAIEASAENSKEARVQQAFFIMVPNAKQLAEIADLLQTGQLKTVVDLVVPFDRAAEAFVTKPERGKVVVTLS